MATDDDPGLPIKLHPCSNGEYVPRPASDLVREAARRARAEAEVDARRVGISRRRFLLSTMGSATVLAALSACSRDAQRQATPGSVPGGTYVVPPGATVDPQQAYAALGGEEFVFDVQTHFLDDSHDIPNLGLQFPQSRCGEGDPRKCFTVDKYLDLLFNRSDTDIVVLSALPFAGNPLDPDVMRRTMELGDRLCGSGRVLMQGEAHPSSGPFGGVVDNLNRLRADYPIGAWKVYCHLGGPGWYLDDHDPAAPAVGTRFLDEVRRLGPPLVAVHKGFSNGSPYASPVDVGPAAKAFGDLRFVVYHSGYEIGVREGPYDPEGKGVDRLIRSCRDAGVGPGGNVYAELGSTWRSLMGDPDQAAHVLGKLLVAFGEDNVVWGTDSIWYGSPQDQLEAFRAFQITPEYQERHGYPELTPARKAKILGLTSAALYGVTPQTGQCSIRRQDLAEARLAGFGDNATYGPRTPAEVTAVATAHAVHDGTLQ